MNLSDLSENYLITMVAEKRASPCTIRSYALDLKQFLRYLESRRVSDALLIDRETLKNFITYLLDEGYSRRSIARKRACLNGFFKFLCREGYLDKNPMKDLSPMKLERKLPAFLEIPEVKRLIETPNLDCPLGLRDRAILETLYATGVRVSELVGLNLTDVDYSLGFVQVVGKGGKERMVPLGSQAIAALGRYLENGRPYLAQKKKRGPCSRALFLNI